jgi:hypothetical protein
LQLEEMLRLLRPAFFTLEEVRDFLFTTLPMDHNAKGQYRQWKEVCAPPCQVAMSAYGWKCRLPVLLRQHEHEALHHSTGLWDREAQKLGAAQAQTLCHLHCECV